VSVEAITKEAYLDELAENAARKIVEGFNEGSRALLLSAWKEIILREMTPILRLIG
jgi:hypothetical protein